MSSARPSPVLLLLLLVACGHAEDPAPTPRTSAVPDEVALDVMVSDDGLEILAVYPLEERRRISQSAAAHLGYELRDESGAVVVSGQISDPRQLRVEHVAEPMFSPFGVASLRLPAVAGELVLLEGAIELGGIPFDPAAVRFHGQDPDADIDDTTDGIGSSSAAIVDPGDVLNSPRRIAGRLPQEQAVDLLIVPEGYTRAELPRFDRDAKAIMRQFQSIISSQRNYRKRFNFWLQDVQSRSTGIDDPDANRFADTAFDVSFGRGDLHRCSWFGSGAGETEARRLGREAGADVVVVLANSSIHGGCALNGVFVMTHTPTSASTMVHELGHALVGLADEYDYGECRAEAAPNVTLTSRREAIPWHRRIKRATELPTEETFENRSLVGAFEGANYCVTGAFRPQFDCLMQNLETPFCAVCLAVLDRYLRALARNGGGTVCGEDMRSDGICDTCLEQDPDCAGGAVCGDRICTGDETDRNCAEDCGCAAPSADCDGVAPFGCYCDFDCESSGDCCADSCEACGDC
jgi:hypothetical protein